MSERAMSDETEDNFWSCKDRREERGRSAWMVVSAQCLPHFSVLREKEEGRTLSLTIHHCQIGPSEGGVDGAGGRRTNREGLLCPTAPGRYGRHVSAVREFPKFWDKYVE